MNTLQIQDAFEPYYAGRKTPVQRVAEKRKWLIPTPFEPETSEKGSSEKGSTDNSNKALDPH